MALVDTFNEAVRLYQAGKLADAEALCAQMRFATRLGHVDVLRLSGMVARQSGELSQADDYLQKALRLAPQHHETLNVIGLLRLDQGRPDAAADILEHALRCRPGYLPAVLNLGRAWCEAGRASEAVSLMEAMARAGHAGPELAMAHARALHAARRVDEAIEKLELMLAAQPEPAGARKLLAEFLMEEGRDSRALEILPPNSSDVDLAWARMRALVRTLQHDAAIEEGQRILDLQSGHAEVLQSRSQLLWMTGRVDEIRSMFETSISRDPQSEMLWLHYIKVLTQMNAMDEALSVADRASQELGRRPGIEFLRADAFIEKGDGQSALAPAIFAAQNAKNDTELLANQVRALLMTGKGAEAMPLILQARDGMPLSQFWIAMEATAARQIGDPAYERLMQYDKFVRPWQLDTPDGYESLDAFNAALLERLLELHSFQQHPLDQSLRLGSQTSVDIKHSEEAIFQAFFASLKKTIAKHIAWLPRDESHPLLSRISSDFRLTGAWSVKLSPGGNHVSHVHPEGWISSAYYVHVPEAVAGAEDREGWINFGAPPFNVEGANDPEHFIEPSAGTLALFPSYMWHGTVPIRKGKRVTIAFDVVPE